MFTLLCSGTTRGTPCDTGISLHAAVLQIHKLCKKMRQCVWKTGINTWWVSFVFPPSSWRAMVEQWFITSSWSFWWGFTSCLSFGLFENLLSTCWHPELHLTWSRQGKFDIQFQMKVSYHVSKQHTTTLAATSVNSVNLKQTKSRFSIMLCSWNLSFSSSNPVHFKNTAHGSP